MLILVKILKKCFKKMNEARLWYCNICDKSIINTENKPKPFISKSHKHKGKFSVVVKGYEFFRPDINRIDYITNNLVSGC